MRTRQKIKICLLKWRTITEWLIICLLLSTTAAAQYRTDLWTTDDGLPQNSVTGLTQTRAGYIWFTTNDGLVRFDGARFTVFNKSNTPEISTNRLAKAFGDQSGRFWFQGEDGSVIYYEKGAFNVTVKPNGIAPDSHAVFFDERKPIGEKPNTNGSDQAIMVHLLNSKRRSKPFSTTLD